MKIDRLLGIITVLLQRDRMTAPELAKKFEVSRRTIQRDIDDICKAGIPIVTCQGGGGGISIADGYKLDKNVFTMDELQNILTGLKSIGSVTEQAGMDRLISKLTPKKEPAVSIKDSILIDLSSHYKSSLSNKIGLIKSAIAEHRLLRFDYYSEKGRSNRIIEPYFITFRWTSWYVYGFCRERNGFRLFKLNRLWNHALLDEGFTPKEIPEDMPEANECFTDENRLTALFDSSMEYRLVEEYGPDCYEVQEDGRLKLTVGYTNREFIRTWILGFGDQVLVLEPDDLAAEIKEMAKKLLLRYEHDI